MSCRFCGKKPAGAREDRWACEGENPPEACREMAFNFASEMVILGGALETSNEVSEHQRIFFTVSKPFPILQ